MDTLQINQKNLDFSQFLNLPDNTQLTVEQLITPISPKDYFIIEGDFLFKTNIDKWKAQFNQINGDGIKGLAYVLYYSNQYPEEYFDLILNQFKKEQFNQKIDLVLDKQMEKDLIAHKPCALNFYFLCNYKKFSSNISLNNFLSLVNNGMDFTQKDENNLSVLYPVVKEWCILKNDFILSKRFGDPANEPKVLETIMDYLIGNQVEMNTYYKTFGYPLDELGSYDEEEIFTSMWSILKKYEIVPQSGPFNYTSMALNVIDGFLSKELDWVWGEKTDEIYKVYKRMLNYLNNTKPKPTNEMAIKKIKVITTMEMLVSNYESSLIKDATIETNLKKKVKLL